MVDGKGVMIAVIDLPKWTPVSLPSTFQLSPESKKFSVMFRYGAVRPYEELGAGISIGRSGGDQMHLH